MLCCWCVGVCAHVLCVGVVDIVVIGCAEYMYRLGCWCCVCWCVASVWLLLGKYTIRDCPCVALAEMGITMLMLCSAPTSGALCTTLKRGCRVLGVWVMDITLRVLIILRVRDAAKHDDGYYYDLYYIWMLGYTELYKRFGYCRY